MHIDPSLKLEAPPWEMLQLLGFDFYKRKELSFYIDCGVFVKCNIEGFQFVANTRFYFFFTGQLCSVPTLCLASSRLVSNLSPFQQN